MGVQRSCERGFRGGDCLNVGCVPSKALIRASRAAAEVRDAHDYGVEVPAGVRMNFPAVMERMRRRVLQENPELPAQAQESLFATTMLFERIVWLARRNALLILPEAGNGQAAASAAALAG